MSQLLQLFKTFNCCTTDQLSDEANSEFMTTQSPIKRPRSESTAKNEIFIKPFLIKSLRKSEVLEAIEEQNISTNIE
ncbi:unnamed protein product [Blepharisma stoltei]|uniref:Uncharacterized protein n=1 Tax=Blepharisma stoltei TaxID=1481888 RepID=A0AAU9IPD5_9CILI|nr:unnamed protein product [Blepharisma stoltei]